jgi:hypothetical protein
MDKSKYKMETGNEYFINFIEEVIKDYGDKDVGDLIRLDGLELFCLRVMFGRKSSSQTLKNILVNRYGYDEVLNDLIYLYENDKTDYKQVSHRLEKLIDDDYKPPIGKKEMYEEIEKKGLIGVNSIEEVQ